MWLRNVYLGTLRGYRIPILGWGIGMGLVVVSPMASVAALIKTPQARTQLAGLAAGFAWNADPIALTTVGGFATWKIGTFIVVIAVWPILAASRVLRGEEERGAMDALLALPQSRVRVALEKLAAIWTALLAMGWLIGLLAFAGGSTFGADFSLVDALLFGLNLALMCAVICGLALLISQFTRERSQAAGWTAGFLLIFVLLDMVHRVMPAAGSISRWSPIYYYNLSKPLIPSYGANAGAMVLLLVLAASLSGFAVWLFTRRDIGGTAPLPRLLRAPAHGGSPTGSLPARDWSLHTVFTRSVAAIAVPTAWWTLGIAGFAAWMVVAVRQMEVRLSRLLADSSSARTLIRHLGGGNGRLMTEFLSAVFSLLPLFLMAFAITQVNRWSADQDEGRLDLVLSTPHSRYRIILARFAALGTATVAMSLAALVASTLAVRMTGLSVDSNQLAAAMLGMIPLAVLMAALGYLAAGWLRTSADSGLLSFLLLIWFCISFIGPELNWPNALQRLSAFYYYGTPLLHGLQLTSIAGVIGISALALGLGAFRFARKDIGT